MLTYSRYSWLAETFPGRADRVPLIVSFNTPIPEPFCPFPEELGPAPVKSTHCGVFQGLSQWDHGSLEVNEANI